MNIPQKTGSHQFEPGMARLGRGILVMLVLCCCWMVPSAEAQTFPPAKDDNIPQTTAVFKITLSQLYGGTTHVVWASGPTCITHSSRHPQTVDPSGPLGDGTACTGSPTPGTSDMQIGTFPPGYNSGGGAYEVHSEITDMMLTELNTVTPIILYAGASAPSGVPSSLGEIEARSTTADFPADSFFNLYLEVWVPALGQSLFNPTPLTVECNGITTLPPWGAAYCHSFNITGRVALLDVAGCFAGWLEQGTHGVGTTGNPGLTQYKAKFPVVFSVSFGAEGLLQPDPCHPWPNDVFSLGPVGPWVYQHEGELFEAAGSPLPGAPNLTNVDRMSAALAIAAPPAGPPYMGPFNPPNPTPPPPGGPGIFGLMPADNINAVSFGQDGGDTLLFSVDPSSMGVPGTAVEFNAVVSPFSGVCINGAGGPPSNGAGGDPGNEAAGDIYVGPRMVPPIGGGANLLRLIPAPFNSNVLVYDELNLGLQAPAVACSALGAPEDDLDALEADTGDAIDPGRDGIPDGVSLFAYFSLDWNSITIMMPTDDPFPGMCTGSDAWAAGGDGVTPDDILISPPPALPIPLFAIFARGVMDIGLVPGDDIDALVLFDGLTPGVLDPGWEVALFSLAAGSPSLTGANPNMPPPPAAGYSPADVYWTRFQGPLGPIWLYASAAQQGLLPTDELNALDIGYAFPCQECPEEEWWCYQDYDLDGIPDLCDNCPDVGNPPEGAWWADPDFGEQVDTDGDGVGDACDSCPFHYNPEQDFVEGCCECFGDMDRSNNVDFYDLDLFVEALLTYPPDECADANEDHFVNGSDVQTFVNLILANGGAGTPCGSEPTGACCQEDLTCIDGTTESECDGPWYEGQLCADITCPPFTCIEPGQDCWVTACDGKTGYGFAQTPLPADFFGPGSDPFDGTVALGGPPYGGSGPFGSDTIVTRLERMCFIDPPPDSVDSTPLELTLLELVSCQPITVTYNGGLDPEDWDVAVSLPGPQDLGELTATKTHANGGTFDSYFFVQPLFTFTQVDPPHYTVSFNPGDAGYDPALLSSSGEPWLHTVTIGASCSPDFAPGYDIVGGDECCEEVCHAGPTPDHPHCVLPPYCETLCPKPPDNDDCEEAKAIGDVVDYAFDTTEATFDGGGTCMTSPNIWFCYSASCTGNLIVSLCGSSYDTKLAVYEGCTCDPLGTMLCCDDDTCGLQSECTVPVVDGGQYLIEVGGYGSNAGQGVMDIRCCLPPPNDDCDDAEVVNSPYPVTLIADLTCASVDCPGVLNWNAVWYDIELPYTSQNVQITVCPLNEDVASGGIILMDDCDCDDHIPADSSQWISCPNSLMGYEMVFSNRTGPGRIYYPVWAIGNSGDRMVLDITIDVIQLGCISPDNGTGTVDLPPVDCPYLSPDEVHQIIDGLPPGTTIELDPIHSWFFNVYRYPGGSLGGEVEEFESGLAMHLTGTGELEGFERYLDVDLNCVVHTGPRTPGDPVQSFPTEMYMMDGELEPGVSDPDFEYLTITAGSSFGLPSPGHTTLTELPTGDYAVDSFFDITYRIDFMGTPYGALAGYSGMTTATLRMEASGPPPPPKGACCVGYTCVATTTEGYCGTLGGTWYGGETCPQYSCPVK